MEESRYDAPVHSQKEILGIDALSATKIGALLGILWAILGWLLNSIVIVAFLAGEEMTNLPAPFSVSALISGILGGFIGGALSGYLGCLVYNFIARKIGGIKVLIRE
ncbi:MAG TPA: hypothetical protein VJB82_04805 [Candidatus Peribacterales bacterium]|nr:hypothetical protein [Candidatus Peribacterales bacterium]